MSIRLKILPSAEVQANDYPIVNLKSPFHHVIDRSKLRPAKQRLQRSPSQTLTSKRLLSYTCPINETFHARLIRIYPRFTFKCHGIYRTHRGISKLLRIRALQQLFTDAHTEEYNSASQYVGKVLTYLVDSFDFQIILSDFNINHPINSKIHRANWNVTSCNSSKDTKEIRGFRGVLRQYGKIPISSCDSILSEIDPLLSTDIDASVVRDLDRIVVVSNTNAFASSYITQYLYRLFPDKEILPVVMFTFNR